MSNPSSTDSQPASYVFDKAKKAADEFADGEDSIHLPSPLQDSGVRAFHAAVDQRIKKYRKARRHDG